LGQIPENNTRAPETQVTR